MKKPGNVDKLDPQWRFGIGYFLLTLGPPGTGKTLLARAVAGEANVCHVAGLRSVTPCNYRVKTSSCSRAVRSGTASAACWVVVRPRRLCSARSVPARRTILNGPPHLRARWSRCEVADLLNSLWT